MHFFFFQVLLFLMLAALVAALHNSNCKSRRTFRLSGDRVGGMWTNPEALLSRALQLSQNLLRKRKEEGIEGNQKNLRPVRLSFSTSFTQPLRLLSDESARTYLALPADQYSLLNSTFISRSCNPDESDIFFLDIPLSTLGVGAGSYNSPKASSFLSTILQTSVTVRPQPEQRLVTMNSGPIFFAPSKSAVLKFTETAAQERLIGAEGGEQNDANDLESFADVFPEWLLWGGRGLSKTSVGTDEDGVQRERGLSSGAVKTSVQAGFKLELTWPEKASPLPQIASDATELEALLDKDCLEARAMVKVWVDLNLPLQEDVSSVVSFMPIKLMLEQAGRLTAAAVLRSLSPTLGSLLIKDYDVWRGRGVSTANAAQLPSLPIDTLLNL